MTTGPSRLQRELKQTRPFRSAAQAATIGLLKTADLVRRHFARVLEPEGVTVQQYNVLRILRGAGPEGLPTLEIAERMIEQAPGITRLLDRLEAKRLVTRDRCPTDRRQVTCRISATGLSLLGRLDAAVDRTDVELVDCWSAAELERVNRSLDRLRESLEARV